MDTIPADLGKQMQVLVNGMRSSGIKYAEGVKLFQRQWFITALESHKGNQCRASREMGIHRNTMVRTCTILGVSPRAIRIQSHKTPQHCCGPYGKRYA